jgi:hypothetical protein
MLPCGLRFGDAINFPPTTIEAVARSWAERFRSRQRAVCSLLILISAVPLSFQIVSAKIVAQQEASPRPKRTGRPIAGFTGAPGSPASDCRIWFCCVFCFPPPDCRDTLTCPGPVPVSLMADWERLLLCSARAAGADICRGAPRSFRQSGALNRRLRRRVVPWSGWLSS